MGKCPHSEQPCPPGCTARSGGVGFLSLWSRILDVNDRRLACLALKDRA